MTVRELIALLLALAASELVAEVRRLRSPVAAPSGRCHAQSEALGRRAEK